MISETEARRAESWIEEASLQGAKLVCGGERQRSVLQPAIIEQVSTEMKVVNREVFAPSSPSLPSMISSKRYRPPMLPLRAVGRCLHAQYRPRLLPLKACGLEASI
jgi:hypothetical protein